MVTLATKVWVVERNPERNVLRGRGSSVYKTVKSEQDFFKFLLF